MTSLATTRYTLDPAPDGLSLPQDFLNTRGVGTQPDLLADVPTATAWVAEALADGVQLSAADLQRLRTFRAELHRLVTPDAQQSQPVDEGGAPATAAGAALSAAGERRPPGGAALPGGGELASGATAPGAVAADTVTPLDATASTANPLSASPVAAGGWSVAAELVLGVDGVVELWPGGGGAEYVISRVLAEVLAGQQVDTWRRLKACKNDRCQVVFYDRSRNNSGVWHSLKTCGNPANLRAFRARNKEASS
ncbi:CGNR zinc finger domain-containing protein [Kribbella sp. NPDC051620]|uniref:CGNR zinc finger domain-containing protein n=1 Tax=Kribbella sp. NPDC051620 TaxID=3364120 RepID=UPI0037B00D30